MADHKVEFTIPFSELRALATNWADQNGIQIPKDGNFDFRIERNEQVGFHTNHKPDALGVKVEKP
jgi:hypothetical protein